MKHLKMLGLAATTALVLMAFVGVGTASATTLATDATGTVKYAAGTTFHLTLEKATSSAYTDTSGNTITTCTGATIHGVMGTATGTWVSISLSTVTWEGCNHTTHTLVPGSLEIMQNGTGDEGTVVGKDTKVTKIAFGVTCVYGFGAGTTLGTITGGEAPTLKITATLPRVEGGFLCPSTGIWHASYIITTPHAVHVVA